MSIPLFSPRVLSAPVTALFWASLADPCQPSQRHAPSFRFARPLWVQGLFGPASPVAIRPRLSRLSNGEKRKLMARKTKKFDAHQEITTRIVASN